MERSTKRQLLNQILLVIWGMATLVLLFSVVFLLHEMLEQGNPPSFMAGEAPGDGVVDTVSVVGPLTREVNIYFPDSEGRTLVAEKHRIEYTNSTVRNCKAALDKLIAGPKNVLLSSALPEESKVRSLYLLAEGELVVDFSRELQMELPKSASAEALMVYSVVNTIAQSVLAEDVEVPVSRVRFLFEGAPPGDMFPAHIDVSEPIAPDFAWIEDSTQDFLGEDDAEQQRNRGI